MSEGYGLPVEVPDVEYVGSGWNAVGTASIYPCENCGALVRNTELHTEWHQIQNVIQRTLLAIAKEDTQSDSSRRTEPRDVRGPDRGDPGGLLGAVRHP